MWCPTNFVPLQSYFAFPFLVTNKDSSHFQYSGTIQNYAGLHNKHWKSGFVAEDDQHSKDPTGWEISYAGIVRPVLANIFARIGHMKVLPKVLAKSADRISTALELREHYYTAKEYQHVSRIKSVYSVILPAFIRSALFGTAVFSAYETLSDYIQTDENMLSFLGVNEASSPSASVLISTITGAVSGATGGLTYYLLDVIGHRAKITHLHSPPNVEVKILRYAISHSVLFGSYEFLKHFLLSSSVYSSVVRILRYLNDESVAGLQQMRRLTEAKNITTMQDSVSSDLKDGLNSHEDTEQQHLHSIQPMTEEDEEVFYSSAERQHHLLAFALCSGIAGGISGILYELFWFEVEWHHWRAMEWHKPWKWSLRRTWANAKLGMGLAFPSTLAFWAYEFGKE